MNFLPFLGADAATGGGLGGGWFSMIAIYAVVIGAFWFFAIRPQKRKEKERTALVSSLAIGDSILTTSGFYGVVIDMMEEVIIVEFGSNKNCRIPMKKDAIIEVEKPKTADEK